jgi:hypothetical protein
MMVATWTDIVDFRRPRLERPRGEDGGRGMHGHGCRRHGKTEHDMDLRRPWLERPRLRVGSWQVEGLRYFQGS